MSKRTWITYAERAFTHDVTGNANSRPSQGGRHLYQVRKTKNGWQRRIVQRNGMHEDSGPIEQISDNEGEAHYATATL